MKSLKLSILAILLLQSAACVRTSKTAPPAAHLANAAAANQPPCRTLSQARITNRAQLSRLDHVCEVTGSLMIYTDDVHSIAMPRLARVGSLVVESENLVALFLPSLLDVASITATAPKMQVLEVPRLKSVARRLALRNLQIQYLDLSALESAEQITLNNCRKLEFIFADNIQSIKLVDTQQVPALAKESEENLRAVANYQSTAELQFRREQQMLMQKYRAEMALGRGINQAIRPTGHQSNFDSFGMVAEYYDRSPVRFPAYEESLDTFKLNIGYQFNGPFGVTGIVWNVDWLSHINQRPR